MREIVQVQIGQCGNRIGTHFWEVISDEHGIDLTGSALGASDNQLYGSSVYFKEKPSQKYEPRAVLIDLEPSALDSIRAGASGHLFNPDMYVFGLTGSGNTWAQGFYGEGRELADTVLDAIRRETETCDCLQGFQICHSIGGGTGSGLGSLLCGQIIEAYPDRILETFTVFPSRQVSDSVLEPYNAALAIPQLVETVGMVMTLDNESLYRICAKNLNLASPTYGDLNHQISAVMGGVTCAMRFPSTPNTDLRKIAVNLIPFPRLHFFAVSYAPMSSRNGPRIALTVPEITEAVFDLNNLMTSAEQHTARSLDRYLRNYTMAVIYRGNVSSYEVETQLSKQLRDNLSTYREWISDNFVNCICATPSKDFPASATLIANKDSTSKLMLRISEQFTAMFRRKAFLHWYTREGMDEMEFIEAESNLNDLVSEYPGCCCYATADDEEEEEEQVEDG